MAKRNPVVHFEMPYKDATRVSKFYEDAFGWEMKGTGPVMGNYVVAHTADTDENNMIKTPGTINGGFFEYNDKEHDRNVPSVVISVDDIKESIKMVEIAGGKMEGEPQEISGIGLWVVFVDSEGNRVSMLQATTPK